MHYFGNVERNDYSIKFENQFSVDLTCLLCFCLVYYVGS